tara:strand:+ start:72 stop:413 length:342 start_codon:yes stop_codon:yes gene_type:complete
MKNEIKDWINDLKQLKRLDEIYKKGIIEFNNYFPYSGKVEEYKEEGKWEKNKRITEEVDSDDPIVKFYFKNCDYTMGEIAKFFNLSDSCVRVRIGKFLTNQKNKKNGKNIKNE